MKSSSYMLIDISYEDRCQKGTYSTGHKHSFQ